MDYRQINKLIAYTIMAIFAFYLLQMVMPFLIYGAVVMVAWRIYLDHQKYK